MKIIWDEKTKKSIVKEKIKEEIEKGSLENLSLIELEQIYYNMK